MPTLREQILSADETTSDLIWAAEHRYREAEALLEASHFSGAVYLSGLACEMWLKLASFRLIGASPATPVVGLLGPIRIWMAARPPVVKPEAYHSLQFWSEHVIRRRSERGNPLPAWLSGRLRHHVVTRLYQDWKIDLRYRQLSVEERHAWRVYNDTLWHRETWNLLWR